MSTRGWKCWGYAVTLGAVLSGPGAAWAQSAGFPGNTGGGSQSGGASINNAPTFDPAAQAAALLIGTYRVPGAPPVDPTATYRVPSPGAAGGSSTTSTASSGTSTSTGATPATTATASTSGSQ